MTFNSLPEKEIDRVVYGVETTGGCVVHDPDLDLRRRIRDLCATRGWWMKYLGPARFVEPQVAISNRVATCSTCYGKERIRVPARGVECGPAIPEGAFVEVICPTSS